MSKSKIGIREVRAVLIALLQDMPFGEPPPVVIRASDDKLFMLITACARIIEEAIQAVADETGKDAIEGLETLFDSMRDHLREREPMQ